ncbi:filamentous hemagglutinin N-terminal domain-containing protein [Candidatus Nitrospira neomarina]|uniref:Filamentous hemagglutinin N-terminal domain-containing protein n=2 Tax=Candidatus Nitrospira neomarina TaxID=3020899 RepID=A0AA96GMR2_9BACT|nr:filamentous hemagglutinin N-terminal domain-containing protein [Candidatus Nitrospira neomarina]
MRAWSFRDVFLNAGWLGRVFPYPQDKTPPQPLYSLPQVNSFFPLGHSRPVFVLVLSSVFLLELFYSSTFGQVVTNITPDGSMGTNVPAGCNVCNITGGTRPDNGSNLFHSFGQFDVGTTGVANFLNDSALPTSNILSRVTGGNPSNILGTIQTQGFGNANLFLMNPAGIVFGKDSTLNVGGATHFTTADYLQLSDGVQFTALPGAQDALLSIAPVAAFGFLESNPASLMVDRSTLSVEAGETLSLVGGNIEISGGNLNSPDGQINLVSIASPGTVTLGDGADIQVNATQLGPIGLSDNASVKVDGAVGGQVIIRGGQLTLDNAGISANTLGLPDGQISNAPSTSKGGINIQVTEDMIVKNISLIQADVFGGSTNGGDIILNVGGSLEILGGRFDPQLGPFDTFSGIRSFAFGGVGNAGDIEVNANKTLIDGEIVGMWSVAFSDANTGNIRLHTNGLEIIGRDPFPSFISATPVGAGQGGNLDIVVAGNISLDNGAAISAPIVGSENGGNITVEAKNLKLTNGSTIQTGTFGAGNSGKTTVILSENLDISSGSFIGSLVDVNCPGPCGAAGDLKVEAHDITIQGFRNAVDPLSSPEFTGIRTRSVAELGGNVDISGNNLFISDNGVIRSASIGSERAGNITLSLNGNLELNTKGQLLATAEGSGNAGDITVLAKNINLSGESSIRTESTSTGNAGTIQLTAADTILMDKSTVTAEAAQASGGNIKFTANEMIQLVDSTISSSVQGDENTAGGDVTLDPDFIILQNSQILAKAVAGKGGNINLVASKAVLLDAQSTLDASSQTGISGSVTIESPIQVLSGTIAPLPDQPVNVATLYASRCVAGEGGHFSTFVDSKSDSVAPTPGTFLASPVLPVTDASQHAMGHDNRTPTSEVSLSGHEAPIHLTAYTPPVLFAQATSQPVPCP